MPCCHGDNRAKTHPEKGGKAAGRPARPPADPATFSGTGLPGSGPREREGDDTLRSLGDRVRRRYVSQLRDDGEGLQELGVAVEEGMLKYRRPEKGIFIEGPFQVVTDLYTADPLTAVFDTSEYETDPPTAVSDPLTAVSDPPTAVSKGIH